MRTKRLNSNTWRPCGKNGRTYHLLSNIEFAVFSILDRLDTTTDIREQFPLLPLLILLLLSPLVWQSKRKRRRKNKTSMLARR